MKHSAGPPRVPPAVCYAAPSAPSLLLVPPVAPTSWLGTKAALAITPCVPGLLHLRLWLNTPFSPATSPQTHGHFSPCHQSCSLHREMSKTQSWHCPHPSSCSILASFLSVLASTATSQPGQHRGSWTYKDLLRACTQRHVAWPQSLFSSHCPHSHSTFWNIFFQALFYLSKHFYF